MERSWDLFQEKEGGTTDEAVESLERDQGEVAAAVKRTVLSVAKMGGASERVVLVRAQRFPSWSWYLRKEEEAPRESG